MLTFNYQRMSKCVEDVINNDDDTIHKSKAQ